MKTQKQTQIKAGGNSNCVKSDQKAHHLYLLSLPAQLNKKRNCAGINKNKIKHERFALIPRLNAHGLHMWPGSSFELRRIYLVSMEECPTPARMTLLEFLPSRWHQIIERLEPTRKTAGKWIKPSLGHKSVSDTIDIFVRWPNQWSDQTVPRDIIQ